MATGNNKDGERMSEEYSRSLSVQLKYCDSCQDDGIQIHAEGFCVDCNNYLCSGCIRAHKKPKPLRHHVLKDKTKMPANKPKQMLPKQTCHLHENQSIKWYCKSHDAILCNLCQASQHTRCEDVKSLVDVSSDIFDSAEFTQVKSELTNLKEEFSKQLINVKTNESNVESTYNRALLDIARSLAVIKDGDLENMKSLETTCDASLKTIADLLTKLETSEDNGVNEHAYLAKRKAESQLNLLKETLNLIVDDNEVTEYRFVPTPPHIKSGMIGTLCEKKYRRTPVKLEDINVKTSSDTRDCWITGIDILGNNRLVVADRWNDKVKVVDMTNKEVTAEIKLDVAPWDLAKIGDKNIAMTTYDNKKILLFSVTDKLTISKTVDKSYYKHCQGMVYDNGSLVVSYNDPDQIEILDSYGSVKRTIDSKDKDEAVRFGNVGYIAKNPDTDILYLSNWSNDKILSMTRDGKNISSFSHQHLRWPQGKTVGRDGRIFVCSYNTHKIYELSSDLSKCEIILDQTNGIKDPCSIVYDDEEYKIYIGSDNKNNIQVFLV